MPIGDAEVASRILGKTVEAFAEGFVVNFLPERKQPLRRLGETEDVLASCNAQ